MGQNQYNSLLLANPDSRPGLIRRKLRPAVRLLRKHGYKTIVVFTRGPGEAETIARKKMNKKIKTVFVAGGDGTINEVINGISGHDAVLGILPAGDRNVLARELGLPLDPEEAAKRFMSKNIRTIDLGCINGRFFSLMASCGYDAHAVKYTDKRLKKFIHRYAYVWAGLKDFVGYKPTRITIELDDGKIQESGTFVIVSNTHYYGGNHQMTPFAELDDGYLDVCIYRGNTQLGLARFALHVFWKQHLSLRHVHYYRARKIKLFSSKPTSVQIDGDYFGELPSELILHPSSLKVLT